MKKKKSKKKKAPRRKGMIQAGRKGIDIQRLWTWR